jgi:hypothetical protein
LRRCYREDMITPAELAELMKVEILEDVRQGIVPAAVKSFSQLHDFVDANCYGGTEKMLEDMDVASDNTDHAHHENLMKMVDLCNPAMDIVDAWIKAGGIAMALTELPSRANAGGMRITIYRKNEPDGFTEPVAMLGDEKPVGAGWFINAKADLLDESDPHMQLHQMGRDFLIYSMYHARDPLYLGYAVENFGAAVKKLGYSLPLKEDEASWLIYEHGDMDAGAPADSQFMLSQIASVFGVERAKEQAKVLDIPWPSRLGPNDKGRHL